MERVFLSAGGVLHCKFSLVTILMVYISLGSFHLLSDDEASFSSKLKLCRLLWISNDVSLPRKRQVLLNWVCGQLSSQKLGNCEFKLALGSLIEFLNSKHLADDLSKREDVVIIKPMLIQTLSARLQTENDDETLRSLISIGGVLFSSSWISCALTSHFDTYAIYVSALASYLIRDSNHASLRNMFQHVTSLLERGKLLLKGYNAQKKALLPFCKHLLSPLLKLHYVGCNSEIVDNATSDRLCSLIERFTSDILFSRENMHMYADLKSNASGLISTSENSELSRRNKKFQRSNRLRHVLSVFQDMSSRTGVGDVMLSHCIEVFFRLFLVNAQREAGEKAAMLKELAKMTCMCENKCADSILSCKKLAITCLLGLLQTSLEHRIYQPAVNQELGENLLQWFKDFFINLVNHYNASSEWISCIIALTNIDKSIVEPLLKSVLLKCASNKSLDSDSCVKIFELVHCLVNTYVKVRQSVRLINIFLLVIDGAVDQKQSVNIETLGKVVEECGYYLGMKFSAELSPTLVIEIWSIVLAKIQQKVDLIEESGNKISSNSVALELLLKFFEKISLQTPIFALWDHLTVRPDLDKCLKQLNTSTEALHNIMLAEKCQIENYLAISVIKTGIDNILEKYIIANSEAAKPGLQEMVFRDNSSAVMTLQSSSDEIPIESLNSLESKLSFVHLTLLKMQKLMEDVAILNISQNCGRHDGEESVKLNVELVHELERLTVHLLSVLNTVDKSLSCRVFVEVFRLLAKFSSVIIRCGNQDVCDWMFDAAAILIFEGNSYGECPLASVSKLFASPSNFSGHRPAAFALLKKASKKLLDLLSDKMRIPVLSVDRALEGAVSDALDAKHSGDLTREETDVALSAIAKYLGILEMCNFTCLDSDQILAVLVHVLHLLKVVSYVVETSSSPNRKEMLNKLIFVFLKIIDGKTIDVLQHCQPVAFFTFVARMKSIGSPELQGPLSALEHELVFVSYRNSPNEAFDNLKKERSSLKTSHPDLINDIISHHTEALIYLVSFGETKGTFSMQRKSSGNRKRKLRTTEQICKKLKLSSEIGLEEQAPSQSGIFSDLKQLYKESCKRLKKEIDVPTKSTYEMSSSSMEAFRLLNSEGDAKLKIDSRIEDLLEMTLECIGTETNRSVLTSKLRFMKSCLRCSELAFVYKESHLEKLILCYDKIFQDRKAKAELDSCLFYLVLKISKERFQKDVLDAVLYCLSVNEDNVRMKCYITFSMFLLDSGLLEEAFQEDVLKVSKGHCCRFAKCLLEALTILITKSAPNVCDADVGLLKSANETVCALLKVKWVKFQTTEICNAFSTLYSIPLLEIYDLKGPVEFYEIFKSYSEVVHNIIVAHKDVSHAASLCISAFRHLLKSAMHLGKQKKDEGNLVDSTYKTSVQCAGILEELFQFVADNNKKDFSKCMSYVVADYVVIISSSTIVPFVKKSFTNAIYHLMSMMDEYDTAMVRRTLPVTSRDAFQSVFLDFGRNFRYKGFV